LARYKPGRSQPRTLDGVQEVMYAAAGSGKLIVGGEEHEVEPGTGAYVVSGETYEVENPGPETLLLVSAVAPQDSAPQLNCRRIYLAPLLEHSLENSGDSPMRIVAVFHPAGDPASRAYEAIE